MSKYQALIDAPSLHDQIMNIQCDRATLDWANTREAYQYGHRDARHAAAELAQAQDATIRALLADLERAEKDAERYRFLAAHCRSTSEHWGGRWSIVVEGPAPKTHDSEDDFDAAIDAALAQMAGGG